MSYRLGIIGAGRVAREHTKAASAAGVEIAAVCDHDRDKAESFVEQFAPGAAAVDSLDALLSVPDMPAAVVAVPNDAHKEVAIAAMEAGCDLLLEKPMALNCRECDAIIDARDRTKKQIQMGFVCRGAPKVHTVRELIERGELGTIYHAKATLLRKRGIPGLGRWFTDRSRSGGGVLIDIGVHLLDLVMHLTGREGAQRVSAICESRFGSPIDQYQYEDMWAGPPDLKGVFDVEDAATALVRFDRRFSLELNVAWAANLPDGLYRDGILLLGDRGGCFFDLWTDQFIVTTEREGKVIDEPQAFDNSNAWDRAWRWQHERFAQVVVQGAPPIAPAEVGRSIQAIVDAMHRSSAEGCEVDIQNADMMSTAESHGEPPRTDTSTRPQVHKSTM